MPTASFLVGEPRGASAVDDEEDFFDMANLSPSLPDCPWSYGCRSGDVPSTRREVKVSLVNGRRMIPEQTISVSASPEVEIVAGGQLPQHELDAVRGMDRGKSAGHPRLLGRQSLHR